ncbi:MAG: glycosyltransferase family 4 protein [Nonomuraea sp.]|nr:glycosyltransferase family 4 protein [Nonomuraea sp.]
MKVRYLLLHAYGMGGTIRTVINQANALARLGHDVEIVSVVRRRDTPRFPLHPGVRLSTLVDQRENVAADSAGRKLWRRVRGKAVPLGETAAGYFTERVERAAIAFAAGLSGGILVTTRPALNLISARYGSRKVIRVGQEHLNLDTHAEPVRKAIARHYGKLDLLTVLTRTDRAAYRRLLPGTTVVRVPNAVHTANQRRSRQQHPVVVAAGRLVKQKGFDLLIPAFQQVAARHPEWRLRIFGHGPRRRELLDLIGDSDAITLEGRTQRLDDELADASVYALSSRHEGLPMVMIEAMTHALPIVAFDCPTGPGEVLTDGEDGLLVPPQDVSALAAGLERLVTDRSLRLRMGAAAARTAEDYTPEAVTPMWEDLFSELLHGERITDSFWSDR